MHYPVRAKDKIILLEEKNLVLINILRDILENEASIYCVRLSASDGEVEQAVANRASRRNEILYEIQDFLYREGKSLPLGVGL